MRSNIQHDFDKHKEQLLFRFITNKIKYFDINDVNLYKQLKSYICIITLNGHLIFKEMYRNSIKIMKGNDEAYLSLLNICLTKLLLKTESYLKINRII